MRFQTRTISVSNFKLIQTERTNHIDFCCTLIFFIILVIVYLVNFEWYVCMICANLENECELSKSSNYTGRFAHSLSVLSVATKSFNSWNI